MSVGPCLCPSLNLCVHMSMSVDLVCICLYNSVYVCLYVSLFVLYSLLFELGINTLDYFHFHLVGIQLCMKSTYENSAHRCTLCIILLLFPSQHCLKPGCQECAIRSTLAEVHFYLRSSLQFLTFATKIRMFQSAVFPLWMEMLAFVFGATLICSLSIFINVVSSVGSEITHRVSCKMHCPVVLVP